MKCSRDSLRLYAVTDRRWLKPGESLTDVVTRAIDGGATTVQLREKNLGKQAFFDEACSLLALCRERNVCFIVNDNVDIAAACGANGIHVGQSDSPASAIRPRLGPEAIIGVSAQTVEQALRAEAEGADYLGVGAVFPTGSKDDADAVSFATLADICNAVKIPVIAIGGITLQNMEALAGTGIAGIAVISAIFAQHDITVATRALKTRADELFS